MTDTLRDLGTPYSQSQVNAMVLDALGPPGAAKTRRAQRQLASQSHLRLRPAPRVMEGLVATAGNAGIDYASRSSAGRHAIDLVTIAPERHDEFVAFLGPLFRDAPERLPEHLAPNVLPLLASRPEWRETAIAFALDSIAMGKRVSRDMAGEAARVLAANLSRMTDERVAQVTPLLAGLATWQFSRKVEIWCDTAAEPRVWSDPVMRTALRDVASELGNVFSAAIPNMARFSPLDLGPVLRRWATDPVRAKYFPDYLGEVLAQGVVPFCTGDALEFAQSPYPEVRGAIHLLLGHDAEKARTSRSGPSPRR